MKFIDSTKGTWIKGRGYEKRVLFSESDLQCKGTLAQALRIRPGEEVGNHHHEKQFEVFCFTSGRGIFIVSGERVKVAAGDVLLVEPGDVHAIVNDSEEDLLYVAFKTNYVKDDLFWEK